MIDDAKKTILVTGGAGFVGSHLCERLYQDGHRVFSLDNYFAGSVDNHIDGVTYIEGHTKDIKELIDFVPDMVFHLGEYARVGSSLFEPEVVWDLNIVGTLAVLEWWREKKFKLIYAGSSTKFTKDKFSDVVAGRDRAPYNFSKAMNSELVHNYGRWYDLPYAVAYFYSVYGPRERSGQTRDSYGTVVETFRQSAIKGEPAVIYGDGEQRRAFTHVLDTVEALILIGQRGVGEEYAISAKEDYSLNQLADMFGLLKTYKEATRTTRSSMPEDTSKLNALGWEQRYQLSDYIEESKILWQKKS